MIAALAIVCKVSVTLTNLTHNKKAVSLGRLTAVYLYKEDTQRYEKHMPELPHQ